jgi:hypothetical protein
MHSNDPLINYNNSRRPIKRVTNSGTTVKDNSINDKTSKVTGSNVVYNRNSLNSGINLNRNKYNFPNQASNKTGIATIFNINDESITNLNNRGENLISLNSNKFEINTGNSSGTSRNENACSCRDSKLIKNLRDEIAGLRMVILIT